MNEKKATNLFIKMLVIAFSFYENNYQVKYYHIMNNLCITVIYLR